MTASDNPFATGRVERLLTFDPTLIGSSWEVIEERWLELGRRACVSGHHGAGKTTFLEAMTKRLRQTAPVECLFFNQQKRGLSIDDRMVLDQCEAVYLIIDGDEYLSWSERRELNRASLRAQGCLFARHRKRGLPELLRLRSNPDLARELLTRISPEWRSRVGDQIEEKLGRVGGNLRELWLECYDLAGNTGN